MKQLTERFRKRQPLLIGILLIVFGSLGSTFAANITLNRNGPIQFAQGIYEIDACQSYILIDLNPDYVNPGDNSAPSPGTYLGQVIINSLDTRSCANTRIGIKFFTVGSNEPLDLYEGGDSQPINELTLEIDNSNNVSIPIQNSNDDESVSQPIFDNVNGTWTVNILKPLATMASVGKLTLESGPRPVPSPTSN
jgi:hypothetical protein